MFGQRLSPAATYAQVGVQTSVESADPHKLILMLFEGAMAAIGIAKVHMAANNVAEKGAAISKAIDIVTNGLEASLDQEAGGDLAERLQALYQYISHRLLWANLKNDQVALDEANTLLAELHSAWVQIAPGKDGNS